MEPFSYWLDNFERWLVAEPHRIINAKQAAIQCVLLGMILVIISFI